MKQINYYETIKNFLDKDVFYSSIHSNIAIELLDNGNAYHELRGIYERYKEFMSSFIVFMPEN